jgi:transposase
MEVLHRRCVGLDVHSRTIVACIRLAQEAEVSYEIETFGTTTPDLFRLRDWIEEHECTHGVMEATGVYWKPVWHVLEGAVELILANAAQVKNLPGRKTDVNDAQWLADLLAHGLVAASFVPDTSVQDLRALTRTRKQLVRERVSHVHRIQKTLEDANIKLTNVLSDVVGASGRRILGAIIEGQTDGHALAELASARVHASKEQLAQALQGYVRAPHRKLLALHLELIDALDGAIASIEKEVGAQLDPFRQAAELLKTMPGVGDTTAQVLLAEIGPDMSRFPTPAHLRSWACLCPRSDESAGKRRSTRIRKGASWLKPVLVQAAWGAIRVKGSHLRELFYRLKTRRGPKKAIVAVAASMLTSAWHMLTRGVPYHELGETPLTAPARQRQAQRLVHRLRELGYDVALTPTPIPNSDHRSDTSPSPIPSVTFPLAPAPVVGVSL